MGQAEASGRYSRSGGWKGSDAAGGLTGPGWGGGGPAAGPRLVVLVDPSPGGVVNRHVGRYGESVTRDRFHGPAALTIPHAMATRAAAPISLGRPPQPDSRPALSPVMGAIRALAQEESSEAMLTAACRELVTAAAATACYVSRIDDGVLREAASWGMSSADDGDYVYLLADYPVTQAVVERGESKAVSLSDPDVDPAEAFVLRDLGMHAVLILRLAVDGHPWGIVEIYAARPRTFGRAEIDVAELIVGQAAGLLARFQHGEALERLYRETLPSPSHALRAKHDYTSNPAPPPRRAPPGGPPPAPAGRAGPPASRGRSCGRSSSRASSTTSASSASPS